MPGPYKSLPLATQLGEGLSPYASDAELVNLMLVPNPPGSRTPFSVQSVPALSAATVSDAGSIRGACVYADSNVIVFVRGAGVYRTALGGGAATLIGAIGAGGDCQMVDAGTHVVIIDASQNIAVAATASAVSTITPPAGSFSDATYMDGYTIYSREGTDEFYISAIDDPLTISALDFSTADALSGDIVGLIADHKELIIFKEKSIEFWYNSGAADFPFVRSSPGVAERGCSAVGSIAKYDNQVFWLGDDLRVYAMQGYQPRPVSTPWVDRVNAVLTEPEKARGSAFVFEGAAYYLLDTNYNNSESLVWSITTNLWHERLSSIVTRIMDVVNYRNPGSAMKTTALCNNSNAATSAAYILSSSVYVDSGSAGQEARSMTLPAVAANGERVFMHELYLDMEKHSAASTVNLTYSDNGGSAYSSAKAADGTLARCRWNRLGSFFQRILRFTFATNSRIAIMGVHARIEAGL